MFGIFSIIGLILIIASVMLFRIELRAQKKRSRFRQGRETIYANLKTKEVDYANSRIAMIDSMAFGLGASGLNILDIYGATENHEQVLSVMEQRFPNELGDSNFMDWFNKVETLYYGKAEGLNTYISGYKGQEAENIAMELLQNKGYSQVALFESKTHPNDDIVASLNGNEVAFSVKNGSADYVKNAIDQNPNSTNYIINSEAYNKMVADGSIKNYELEGIHIMNGGYSSEQLSQQGASAFDDIHDVGGLTDDIPGVAIAIFGLRTIKNIKHYRKGTQTKYELGTNIGVDAARITSGGVLAAGGGKIGFTIGTMITPGIGSLIGGGTGAIIGALAGGSLFNWAKDTIKWGSIIGPIEYFGDKYYSSFSPPMKSAIANSYFDYDNLNRKIKEEKEIVRHFEEELDPYNAKKLSLQAIISREHLQNLMDAKSRIDATLQGINAKVMNLCNRIASSRGPKDHNKRLVHTKRLIGDILMGNQWILEADGMTAQEQALIDQYNSKIKIAQNHPYRIDADRAELFQGLLLESFSDRRVLNTVQLKSYRGILLFLCIVVLIIGIKFILQG